MAFDSHDAPKTPAAVERFVKDLVVTLKAVVLYPPSSSIPEENARAAAERLNEVLRDRPEMRLAVHKNGLLFDGGVVHEGQRAYESFAQELYNRGLAEVRFHAGATAADIAAFLGVLKSSPSEVAAAGGFETRLWDLGVDTVTVREAAARIVDADTGSDEPADGEAWPPPASRIDDIVTAAADGRPRDQRLLVRLLADEEAFDAYLTESLVGRGVDPHAAVRELQIQEFAKAAGRVEPEQRADLYASIAGSIGNLDPEVRRMLVSERLLPDARTDESVAALVRHMDIDQVCEWMVGGVAEDTETTEGLARAIRNLALISLADRDEVINAAGAAMRASGVSEETTNEVMETVSPSHLLVQEQARPAEERLPADSILKLVDLAPGAKSHRFDEDEGFAELRDEAARGVSDGDVVAALVTLVTVDVHGSAYSAMMALLEDNLDLTLERGDFDIAADAAQSLSSAIADPSIPEERRKRMGDVLAGLATADELSLVTRAMRTYEAGSPEYDACERLLGSLGHDALEPLLEILADEPEMAARKALVDSISRLAPPFVDELAVHVSDPRWYFVRNVVAILGSTKSPAALGALGRTLHHTDTRVRRETIRALAGVSDGQGMPLLVGALGDTDSQNVQLAARYLGTADVPGAIDALEEVARGEGRGSREPAPRVEAIEALGRVGSSASVPTLEALAARRTLRRGSARELSAAADQALKAIRARSRQGGGR